MPMSLRAVCATALLAVQGSALRLDNKENEEVEGRGEFKWPSDYTMDETVNILWYGYDIGHEIQGFIHHAPKSRVMLNKLHLSDYDVPPSQTPPNLVVLGPKDSGVSLLMEILEMNYQEETKEACGWNEKWVDHDRPWKGHLFCRAYPHGLVMENSRVTGAPAFYEAWTQQDVPMDQTVVLFVVKSPMATFQSWTTSFREKGPCLKRSATEYNTPCNAIDVTWKDWGNRVRTGETGLAVSSTVELYNMYMRMYHQIMQDNRFKNAMFITYEDLVQDTADVVLRIAHAMGWKAKGFLEIAEGIRAGPTAPPAPGRPLMMEEMKNRTWLNWTPKAIRDEWCQALDMSTFMDIMENSNHLTEFKEMTYGMDCEEM